MVAVEPGFWRKAEDNMLKRFELKKATKGGGWALHNQEGDQVREFAIKADALKGGVLEGIVGEGTVRIHREDGEMEEERTFPRASDPRRSPG
jgi:hypothetical protein